MRSLSILHPTDNLPAPPDTIQTLLIAGSSRRQYSCPATDSKARTLMFRLAVHVLHPRSTAEAFPGLERTATVVRMALSAGATARSFTVSALLPSVLPSATTPFM